MIFHSGATHDRSQGSGCRSREHSSGFLDAVLFPPVFAGRLVEPGLHKALPIFVEVPIRDHVITLPHLELEQN